MVNRLLASRAPGGAPCTRAGGELYVWTVDDARAIARIEAAWAPTA